MFVSTNRHKLCHGIFDRILGKGMCQIDIFLFYVIHNLSLVINNELELPKLLTVRDM